MRIVTEVSDRDIEIMQSIASDRWQTSGPDVDHHVGDIAWGLQDRSLRSHLILIDDVGYALRHADPYAFEVRPRSEHLYGELIDVAEPDATFWTLDTETGKIAALTERGYVAENDGHSWHLVCDLGQLPPVVVPDGWTVRDATDPQEWPARVGVHRAAWHPSRFTEERYEVVRNTAPYRADLDVGVVAPSGEWAAYCIAWLDERAKVGELEPVGTAPAYRRRGLGAAACLTALHRLRSAGAHRCVVMASTNPENQGPRRLYESIGFRVAGRHLAFKKP